MKVIIIGGVAGGATAAARLRRLQEKAEIIVFEKGEYVSFANCGLPYHLSNKIPKRDSLILKRPKDFKSNYNIDVRIKSEVLSIDRKNKRVSVKDIENNRIYEENYDKLILSPGAKAFTPDFKNEEGMLVHVLKTLPDMDKILSEIETKKVKKALVLGGGFIGVEIAENLTERGITTHLVELGKQVMIPFDFEMANIIHKELIDNGVHLHLGTSVKEIKNNSVHLTNGQVIGIDMIISAVGVRPESNLAKDCALSLNEKGAIKTNEFMQTSDPDIYAVGDAIEVKNFINQEASMLPLAGPANRQGRIAADHLSGLKVSYQGVQGTSIIKVFDLAAASTGMNEKNIKSLKSDLAYDVFYLHPNNHVTYYPGSTPITMKVIYEKKTFKILGAQAIGPQGVDKKIDVLATAIRGGMSLLDLADVEYAYAPPFGSAKDAINMLGFMAHNVKDKLVRFVSPALIKEKEIAQIIDVRTKEEFQLGHIPEAINIPLHELRKRVGELDKSKKTLVYCAVGVRSWNAYRILAQNGFGAEELANLYNLSGGYKNYKNFTEDYSSLIPAERKNMPCLNVIEGRDGDMKYEMNLIGMQCPGPIVALKKKLDEMNQGDILAATVSDKGFIRDVASFCESMGHQLVDVNQEGLNYRVRIIKGKPSNVTVQAKNKKTLVVFSNDLDKAMASFIIANGAAAMGSQVTLFFTFWGLSLLKKENHIAPVKKSLTEKMMSAMLSKGSKGTKLSKMNMLGMGTLMMKHKMKKKNVNSLAELIAMASQNGIRMVACSMTMEVMGIKESELIDGVEIAGVANYLAEAEQSNTNLFI